MIGDEVLGRSDYMGGTWGCFTATLVNSHLNCLWQCDFYACGPVFSHENET